MPAFVWRGRRAIVAIVGLVLALSLIPESADGQRRGGGGGRARGGGGGGGARMGARPAGRPARSNINRGFSQRQPTRRPAAPSRDLGRQGDVGRQRDASRQRDVQRQRDVNRDVNRDIDSDWHVDYDYDHGWHPLATAAAVATTAAVIGSVAYSLPPSCSSVVVNGVGYQQCGSTWYEPQFSGDSVTYIVVNPP